MVSYAGLWEIDSVGSEFVPFIRTPRDDGLDFIVKVVIIIVQSFEFTSGPVTAFRTVHVSGWDMINVVHIDIVKALARAIYDLNVIFPLS